MEKRERRKERGEKNLEICEWERSFWRVEKKVEKRVKNAKRKWRVKAKDWRVENTKKENKIIRKKE